ncbi:hypothetical protein NVT87_09710 [Acinetobacter radioresistens]|uniref:hypothetical protein n=1 Tax=Acinetobacter radioresistens TaxID=40216 RepID=UPI002245000F|nr:hypothetical protein [Acinetobacter radioresistens]MCX0331157.1 hypothetical protein [Acinetobacter radioresistens]
MLAPDEKDMFEVLEKQQQHQRQVDRVFKIVLPITAFLLSVICANMNWASWLGTFIILTIAFYAVGIKRLPLWHWLVIVLIYCLIDNFLTYKTLHISGLSHQFGTMFIFLGIVGIGRPYFDRWLMKK